MDTEEYGSACPICYNPTPLLNVPGCICECCSKCLKEWTITYLKREMARTNNPQTIPCPTYGCEVRIDLDIISHLLDQGEMEEVNDVLVKKYIINSRDTIMCPKCNTGGWIDIYIYLPDSNKLCNTPATCEHCLNYWHLPHQTSWKCKLKNRYREFKTGLYAVFIQRSCKDCPNCGVKIDKTGGCSHMNCKCGKAFCWVCGQPFGNGFSHAHTNPQDNKEMLQWIIYVFLFFSLCLLLARHLLPIFSYTIAEISGNMIVQYVWKYTYLFYFWIIFLWGEGYYIVISQMPIVWWIVSINALFGPKKRLSLNILHEAPISRPLSPYFQRKLGTEPRKKRKVVKPKRKVANSIERERIRRERDERNNNIYGAIFAVPIWLIANVINGLFLAHIDMFLITLRIVTLLLILGLSIYYYALYAENEGSWGGNRKYRERRRRRRRKVVRRRVVKLNLIGGADRRKLRTELREEKNVIGKGNRFELVANLLLSVLFTSLLVILNIIYLF